MQILSSFLLRLIAAIASCVWVCERSQTEPQQFDCLSQLHYNGSDENTQFLTRNPSEFRGSQVRVWAKVKVRVRVKAGVRITLELGLGLGLGIG